MPAVRDLLDLGRRFRGGLSIVGPAGSPKGVFVVSGAQFYSNGYQRSER